MTTKSTQELAEMLELQNIIDSEEQNECVNTQNETKQEIKCITCNTDEYIVVDSRNANMVCKKCGHVFDIILDDNPEWHNYDDDQHGSINRCSMPINVLLPQSSLGTTISGHGKNILRILHNWSAMPYKERSFNTILKKIEEICAIGNIEKRIEQDAKILCKQVISGTFIDDDNVSKTVIIRGEHRKSIIAASIFYACRRNGKTRSTKEIGAISNVDYTNITSGCTAFSKLAQIKGIELNLGISDSEHFIKRYCADLKLSKYFTNETIRIMKNVKKLNIASTHTPISIAIAVILLLANTHNIDINKKTIKNMLNISEVTINKTLKKVNKYKDIIINDDYCNMICNELNKNAAKSDELSKLAAYNQKTAMHILDMMSDTLSVMQKK
jgi:transcription initiation factor TFIIB